jgi:hypothetical protein
MDVVLDNEYACYLVGEDFPLYICPLGQLFGSRSTRLLRRRQIIGLDECLGLHLHYRKIIATLFRNAVKG